MQYQDHRTPVVWEVGDLILTTSDQRFMIIQVTEAVPNHYALLSTLTCQTSMSAPDIATLKTNFTNLYSVTEVINGSDTMIIAV